MHHLFLARLVQKCCAEVRAQVRFSTPNMLQQGGQTSATCWVQQCCEMVRSNVVIVWPELANAGSTMLGYVVLKCSDRLLALSAVDSLVFVGQKRDRGKIRSSSVTVRHFYSQPVRARHSNNFFVCLLEIGNVVHHPEVF